MEDVYYYPRVTRSLVLRDPLTKELTKKLLDPTTYNTSHCHKQHMSVYYVLGTTLTALYTVFQ